MQQTFFFFLTDQYIVKYPGLVYQLYNQRCFGATYVAVNHVGVHFLCYSNNKSETECDVCILVLLILQNCTALQYTVLKNSQVSSGIVQDAKAEALTCMHCQA